MRTTPTARFSSSGPTSPTCSQRPKAGFQHHATAREGPARTRGTTRPANRTCRVTESRTATGRRTPWQQVFSQVRTLLEGKSGADPLPEESTRTVKGREQATTTPLPSTSPLHRAPTATRYTRHNQIFGRVSGAYAACMVESGSWDLGEFERPGGTARRHAQSPRGERRDAGPAAGTARGGPGRRGGAGTRFDPATHRAGGDDTARRTLRALGVRDPDGGLSEFVYEGITTEQRARMGHLPEGHGLLGLLMEHPRAVRVSHLGAHRRRSASRRTTPRWTVSWACRSSCAARFSAASTSPRSAPAPSSPTRTRRSSTPWPRRPASRSTTRICSRSPEPGSVG